MTRRFLYRALVMPAAFATVLGAAGCDDLLGRVTGAYRGPRPNTANLQSEVVIVRSIAKQPEGASMLILDRVRYYEGGQPHDVNRVVKAYTAPVEPGFASLVVQPGERLVVSTRFIAISETGDRDEVPDWPGHEFAEYPIGFHHLTSAARNTP